MGIYLFFLLRLFFHRYLQVAGVWIFPWQPSLCSQPNYGHQAMGYTWASSYGVSWERGDLQAVLEEWLKHFVPAEWMGDITSYQDICTLFYSPSISHPFKENGSSISNWILCMERTVLTPIAGKTVGEGVHFRQASRFALSEAHPHKLKKNPYTWSDEGLEAIRRAQGKIRLQCLLWVKHLSTTSGE